MEQVITAIFYCIAFLAVYVQVFFLVTFFERRKDILIRTEHIELTDYPSVTIVVPCYNEEKTVEGTINSILALSYPADKLKISIVDDGSKDGTWNVVSKFDGHPQITLFAKENGGKHTALNHALASLTTDFVGCLDADSSVHPEALKRIMTYFDDKDTMAVAPSIVVRDPKTLIQYAQAVEYDMGHYMKKMLAFNGAIHVTPGPFSIFRKEVFENLGPYRKAHNTEDQEIALRMQKHGYKIEHAPDAYVFTNSPNTIPKLYRQRVRWIYGFIKNAIDYKELIFRSKYGNIGLFTIPSGMISISATIIMLSFTFYQWAKYIEQKAVQINTTGLSFSFSTVSFDFFYFSTKMAVFISVLLYTLVIFSLINGRSMIPGRKKLSWDIFLFVIIYSVVSPVWLLKSVWNAIWSRESSWTGERNVS